MKYRRAWLLPTAMSVVLGALLIGLSMGDSGAFFTDQVTVEGVSVKAGEWVTPSPTPTPAQVAATVVITPQMLKKGESDPITARITLPAGHSVGDIDTTSILLCAGEDPCSEGIAPSTTAADTTALTATFTRADVIELLRTITLPPNGKVNLAVSGRLGSDIFVGSYEIQVQKGALDSTSDLEPLIAPVEPTPLVMPTPSPTPTVSEEPPAEPSPTPSPTPAASEEPPVEPSPTPEESAAPPVEGDALQP